MRIFDRGRRVARCGEPSCALFLNKKPGFTECAEDLPAIALSALKDGETSYFVAVEDKASVIKKAVFDNVYVDPSGKSIYFIADVDPKTFLGNLYKASVSKSGVNRGYVFL